MPRKTTTKLDRLCLNRAQTQKLFLIKPPIRNQSRHHKQIFILIIGATGNEYIISLTKTSLKCNCPDASPVCKHIIFVLLIELIQSSLVGRSLTKKFQSLAR